MDTTKEEMKEQEKEAQGFSENVLPQMRDRKLAWECN